MINELLDIPNTKYEVGDVVIFTIRITGDSYEYEITSIEKKRFNLSGEPNYEWCYELKAKSKIIARWGPQFHLVSSVDKDKTFKLKVSND